jgi:hypothetical protein
MMVMRVGQPYPGTKPDAPLVAADGWAAMTFPGVGHADSLGRRDPKTKLRIGKSS